MKYFNEYITLITLCNFQLYSSRKFNYIFYSVKVYSSMAEHVFGMQISGLTPGIFKEKDEVLGGVKHLCMRCWRVTASLSRQY